MNRVELIAAVMRTAREAKGVLCKRNYRGHGVIIFVILSTGRRKWTKMRGKWMLVLFIYLFIFKE